jgi:hypothetical protein
MWRAGELPPREPVQADERGWLYVRGAARYAGRRIVAASDPVARLKREAFLLGDLAASTGVDPAAPAGALAVAASQAGIPVDVARTVIRTNLMAGMAKSGRKLA